MLEEKFFRLHYIESFVWNLTLEQCTKDGRFFLSFTVADYANTIDVILKLNEAYINL